MEKPGAAPEAHVNGKAPRPRSLRIVAGLAALVALAALLYTCGTAASAPPATASSREVTAGTWRSFDRWLASRSATEEFSGTALVAKGGQLLLAAGYGMADRDARIRNTARTKFSVASIGKLFTAVAIAQLVEQHKLSFDDTIGNYVTGFAPAVADHVTIAELLDMTSGLGDEALSSANPPTTIAGLLGLIDKEPLQFTPGSRFVYSNDGYILLGAIIERVSRRSYGEYLDEHIFKPAGMTQTDVSVYTPAHVPGMAHGYILVGDNGQPLSPGAPPAAGQGSNPQAGTWQDNSKRPQIANPSGGAYSTVGDLLHFAEALLDHKLLSPSMTAIVLTPRVNAPQPGGPPVDEYTYGFAYQAIDGVAFIGHNGGTPGYAGQIDIYPKTGYVVVILTNQDQTLVPAIQKSEAILTRSGTP